MKEMPQNIPFSSRHAPYVAISKIFLPTPFKLIKENGASPFLKTEKKIQK